jgi:serpin B
MFVKMKTTLAGGLAVLLTTTTLAADSTVPAANAINALGIDLLRQTAKPDANALLSPYSIGTDLAMTYAGADGGTRDEISRVAHLPSDEAVVHGSFRLLQQEIIDITRGSAQELEKAKSFWTNSDSELSKEFRRRGITNIPFADPITLSVANRLFGQRGFAFRDDFLKLLKTDYNAPLEQLDFVNHRAVAAKSINDWVDEQTKHRIQNVISEQALTSYVRLVLVDAIYLKAPWEHPFFPSGTKPLPFHIAGGATADVPTMTTQKEFGYKKFRNFTAITLPYKGDELQFVILLPDAINGLAGLEGTALPLDQCTNLPEQEVVLYLPKFKIAPPPLPLAKALKKLGMGSAFEMVTANFERMTADKPMFISDVYHATFIDLDEEGTEAAAATAVYFSYGALLTQEPPEVRVDHPFLFAIQHRASGACLFLGHVVDPR